MIDGRTWKCDTVNCTAAASDFASGRAVPGECGRAAKKLGAFAAYETGKRVLSAAELATCNTHAPA